MSKNKDGEYYAGSLGNYDHVAGSYGKDVGGKTIYMVRNDGDATPQLVARGNLFSGYPGVTYPVERERIGYKPYEFLGKKLPERKGLNPRYDDGDYVEEEPTISVVEVDEENTHPLYAKNADSDYLKSQRQVQDFYQGDWYNDRLDTKRKRDREDKIVKSAEEDAKKSRDDFDWDAARERISKRDFNRGMIVGGAIPTATGLALDALVGSDDPSFGTVVGSIIGIPTGLVGGAVYPAVKDALGYTDDEVKDEYDEQSAWEDDVKRRYKR